MNNTKKIVTEELISLLEQHPRNGLPFDEAISELSLILTNKGIQAESRELEDAVEQTLDRWEIDKVIDFALVGMPRTKWFLIRPEEEEREKLRALPAMKQTLIRLLHARSRGRLLGDIRRDEAMQFLREQEFQGCLAVA